MKTQIRTYIEPKLADRLTILSQTSGLSLSALTAELIAKGLDVPLDQPPIKREDAQLSLNDTKRTPTKRTPTFSHFFKM